MTTKNDDLNATRAPRDAESAKAPRFGIWDHLGWKLPPNFDDPDPEIEALFHGDDKPEGEL
jgi:hypothetical protein